MDYDYIIVGSGVAGTTVALELLKGKPNLSILMLEAGPITTLKDRRLWWDYVKTGEQPYAKSCEDEHKSLQSGVTIGKTPMELKGSRLMTYGGSTVHWGGWSLRLKPEDFELQSNTGIGIDWPISYFDLKPYYTKAESYLSVCGENNKEEDLIYPIEAFPYAPSDLSMIEGLNKLNYQYSKMPIARYRKCMATGTCKYCPIGARYTAAYILDELDNNCSYPNFTIRCNTPVRQLITNNAREITGVEAIDRDSGQVFSVIAKRVILACGTIETPKLLLASKNEHFPLGIGNTGNQVGKNFIVHPFLLSRGFIDSNPTRQMQEYDFATLMSREFDTKEYQKYGKLFIFKSRSRPRTFLGDEMKKGKNREQLIEKIEDKMEFEVQAFMEDFPDSKNYVSIKDNEFDRFGLPLSQINYAHPEDFKERMDMWLEKMKSILIAMGATPSPDPKHHTIRSARADHAGGTCRMATNSKEGVVDKNLKVFGTNNLFIISNAVFPNLGAVNPTLTLTSLAFRLADYLKKNLS